MTTVDFLCTCQRWPQRATQGYWVSCAAAALIVAVPIVQTLHT